MTADKSANFLSKACAAPVPGSFCKSAARQASSLRNRPATRPRLTPTTIGVVGSNRPSTSRCAPTSVHRCLPPASAGSFCKSTDTSLSPLPGSFCKRAEWRAHSFPDRRLTHAATASYKQIGFVYANAPSAPDHIHNPVPASFCKPATTRTTHPASAVGSFCKTHPTPPIPTLQRTPNPNSHNTFPPNWLRLFESSPVQPTPEPYTMLMAPNSATAAYVPILGTKRL
jgi:hypothetical protein